jgi:hypothetical protein
VVSLRQLIELWNEVYGASRESPACHTQNLTSCSKLVYKPSTSCVRTACPKLSTSMEQAVNNL